MTHRGFTLIELLVVMAIVATLLTLVAPRYFQHIEHSKEVVLRQNLAQVRDALDKFRADQGKYPASLDELVDKRYIRSLPVDPVTERNDTWTIVAPPSEESGSVGDIKSGAPGKAGDGSAFAEW